MLYSNNIHLTNLSSFLLNNILFLELTLLSLLFSPFPIFNRKVRQPVVRGISTNVHCPITGSPLLLLSTGCKLVVFWRNVQLTQIFFPASNPFKLPCDVISPELELVVRSTASKDCCLKNFHLLPIKVRIPQAGRL